MSEKKFVIKSGKIQVEVPENIYFEFYRAERRMRYYEHDIKIDTYVRDKDGNITKVLLSKEVPLENPDKIQKADCDT